jgi:hypothetical protein
MKIQLSSSELLLRLGTYFGILGILYLIVGIVIGAKQPREISFFVLVISVICFIGGNFLLKRAFDKALGHHYKNIGEDQQ